MSPHYNVTGIFSPTVALSGIFDTKISLSAEITTPVFGPLTPSPVLWLKSDAGVYSDAGTTPAAAFSTNSRRTQ